MLNNTTGRFDNFLGIKENFIYYSYSHNAEFFYEKIDMNFENFEQIKFKDIPKDLIE